MTLGFCTTLTEGDQMLYAMIALCIISLVGTIDAFFLGNR